MLSHFLQRPTDKRTGEFEHPSASEPSKADELPRRHRHKFPHNAIQYNAERAGYYITDAAPSPFGVPVLARHSCARVAQQPALLQVVLIGTDWRIPAC